MIEDYGVLRVDLNVLSGAVESVGLLPALKLIEDLGEETIILARELDSRAQAEFENAGLLKRGSAPAPISGDSLTSPGRPEKTQSIGPTVQITSGPNSGPPESAALRSNVATSSSNIQRASPRACQGSSCAKVNVTIAREHFTCNPTNCAPQAISRAISVHEGATQLSLGKL